MTHTDTETEHVARAICAAMGHDPDKRLQFDPTQIVDPPVMLRTMQPAWTFYAVQARAHIAAFKALAGDFFAPRAADAEFLRQSQDPTASRPARFAALYSGGRKSGPKAGED